MHGQGPVKEYLGPRVMSRAFERKLRKDKVNV